MRIKRTPTQSIGASPFLDQAAFTIVPSLLTSSSTASASAVKDGAELSSPGNMQTFADVSMSQDWDSASCSDYEGMDVQEEGAMFSGAFDSRGSRKRRQLVSGTIEELEVSGLLAAKSFLEKAILLVGLNSNRIPTHRELLSCGLTNSIQVKARKYLVGINAISVNVRTRLIDPFYTLGDLNKHIDSLIIKEDAL